MEKTPVTAGIVTYNGYEEAVQAARSVLQHKKDVDLHMF